MHLHNFLVDEHEASTALASSNAGYFSGFSAAQNVEQDDNMDPNAEQPCALVKDNDAHHPSGRPSNKLLEC
jgi:hypothetical protein